MKTNPSDFLLLFDIDGTLLQVKGSVNHEIIAEALSGTGVKPEVVKEVSFAGRTDRDIFLSLPGADENIMETVSERYYQLMETELDGDDIELMPGVIDCLEYVYSSGYNLGLITGNARQAAFIKLKKAGLDQYFQTGGFGDHHRDRNFLPEMARQANGEQYNSRFDPSHTVIIGDTPNDIRCARHDQCHAIAVATGTFSYEQLHAHSPDLLLRSIENPENWLEEYLRRF